jgi:hypothetical protein
MVSIFHNAILLMIFNNRMPFYLTQNYAKVTRNSKSQLENDILKHAYSYGLTIILISKKEKIVIMCIDYIMLNKITMKIKYPIQRIEDLFLDIIEIVTSPI